MHDKLHYTGSECKRIINVCWHNWDLQWAPLELSAFVPRSIKVVWIIKTGPSIIFSLNKFKKKQQKKTTSYTESEKTLEECLLSTALRFRLCSEDSEIQVQTVIIHLGRVHLQLIAEQRQWFLWTPH